MSDAKQPGKWLWECTRLRIELVSVRQADRWQLPALRIFKRLESASHKLSHAGDGDFGGWGIAVPVVTRGLQLLLRLFGLLPGERLTGVAGHAGGDRHQCAGR